MPDTALHVTAYLLCAGFGTRMRPLTEDTPKSLLPVAGHPILDYLLDELRGWNALNEIRVAANRRDAGAFRTWAKDWRGSLAEEDVTLTIHDDGVTSIDEQLGAVGDLRFLLEETGLPSSGALVSGGDSLYRFPLAPVLNAFNGTCSRLLALHEPDPERRRQSTVLELNGNRLTGLVENPSATDSTWIGPSWHLLTPSALAAVSPYLRAGGDPDALGAFIAAVLHREPIEAVRLPRRAGLRLHCNEPDDLERARTVLDNEPRHLLSADDIQSCLPD